MRDRVVTSASGSTDVLIAGAGLAGSVAAHALATRGVRVTLVDPSAECPRVFKAEKIETHHAAMLREFGLLEAVAARSGHIHTVIDARNGRVVKVTTNEQFGLPYHELVNIVRAQLPNDVDVRVCRVQDIVAGSDYQKVLLDDGTVMTARLVVMACGTSDRLSAKVGLRRHKIAANHSVAFGFDVEATGRGSFPFDSMTYAPDGWRTGIGYLTLFPLRDRMRANLFAFRSLNDEWSRELLRDPKNAVVTALPRLRELTGDFHVTSDVARARIDLYTVDPAAQVGVVPIGDSYQSVCPTTGTGLTKVLTDARVLCDSVPRWLETPGMGLEKTSTLFQHERKRHADERSLRLGLYHRDVALGRSLRWRVHRTKVDLQMLWAGWPDARRMTRTLRAARHSLGEHPHEIDARVQT